MFDIFYSTISGRLVDEPKEGQGVTRFSVAVNLGKDGKDENGKDKYLTNFITISVFGDLGTWANKTLTKGDRVTILGKTKMISRQSGIFLNMTADQIFAGEHKKASPAEELKDEELL